jgi:hypothetical protein
MVEFGTLFICCAFCSVAGVLIGSWKSARECSKMAEMLHELYSRDKELLIKKIIELAEKGGAE